MFESIEESKDPNQEMTLSKIDCELSTSEVHLFKKFPSYMKSPEDDTQFSFDELS